MVTRFLNIIPILGFVLSLIAKAIFQLVKRIAKTAFLILLTPVIFTVLILLNFLAKNKNLSVDFIFIFDNLENIVKSDRLLDLGMQILRTPLSPQQKDEILNG